MKIFMLSTQNAGVAWWRHQTPAAALRAAGHEVVVFEEEELAAAAEAYGGIWGWLCANLDKYDIVHTGYSHSDVLTKILVANRHKNERRFIVDIDDDLDTVPSYNLGFKTFGPAQFHRETVRAQLLVADAVSTSTTTLRDALRMSKTKYALPNLVHPPDWDYPVDPDAAHDNAVRILLAGGESRYADWEILKEPLTTLAAKYDGREGRPKVRIIFFGWYPDWAAHMLASPNDAVSNCASYIQSTSSIKRFCQALRWVRPDIYLSPVLKNPFNASKSDLKAMEAGMTGAVLACTDFTTYADVPSEVCSKVDNTYTQWYESLAALVEDPTLRQRKATACRDWTLSTRDVRQHVGLWVDAYEATLAAPPITRLEDILGEQT